MDVRNMADDLRAQYREAADALVQTWPPVTEATRRRLLDITARSARRRKAA